MIRFVLLGSPRTKKNSRRHVRKRLKGGKLGGIIPLPSSAYAKWHAYVLPQLRLQVTRHRERGFEFPIASSVNVRALFYRDALRGDAVGYYQALADLLEDAGVVDDDVRIVSWDGTRLAKDAGNPRVEVEITFSN